MRQSKVLSVLFISFFLATIYLGFSDFCLGAVQFVIGGSILENDEYLIITDIIRSGNGGVVKVKDYWGRIYSYDLQKLERTELRYPGIYKSATQVRVFPEILVGGEVNIRGRRFIISYVNKDDPASDIKVVDLFGSSYSYNAEFLTKNIRNYKYPYRTPEEVTAARMEAKLPPLKANEIEKYAIEITEAMYSDISLATYRSSSHKPTGADFNRATFEKRRNLANGISAAIESRIEGIDNLLLQLAMTEIARDMRSLPQKGYGDASYWSAILGQQATVMRRVAQKLDTISAVLKKTDAEAVNVPKELGLSCEDLFAM